jgi:hypothetical protein
MGSSLLWSSAVGRQSSCLCPRFWRSLLSLFLSCEVFGSERRKRSTLKAKEGGRREVRIFRQPVGMLVLLWPYVWRELSNYSLSTVADGVMVSKRRGGDFEVGSGGSFPPRRGIFQNPASGT